MHLRNAWTLLALALVACTPRGNPPSDGGTGDCSIAVTGAVTGNFGCRDLSMFHRTSSNDFTFSLGSEDDAPLVMLTSWKGPGQPTARTYDGHSDDTVQCSVTVKDQAKTWWVRDQISDPVGTCTLVFSSVSLDATVASTISYLYAGTLTAELAANTLTGASGTVQVSATFEYR